MPERDTIEPLHVTPPTWSLVSVVSVQAHARLRLRARGLSLQSRPPALTGWVTSVSGHTDNNSLFLSLCVSGIGCQVDDCQCLMMIVSVSDDDEGSGLRCEVVPVSLGTEFAG